MTRFRNLGGQSSGGSVTPDSSTTFTNKIIDDYTNTVHADAIHLRVKANEELVKGDVIKFVGFNAGEQAIEVAKRNDLAVPAIGVIYTASMATGDFGMAVSNGLFKGINTSAFSVGTILYPNASGGFTATNPGGYAQQLAYVVRSHAVNGEIMINVGPVYGGDKRGLTGNAGTNPTTNFIGTTDAQPLVVKTNNTERVRVLSNGNVGIGQAIPLAPLHVEGTVRSTGNIDIRGTGSLMLSNGSPVVSITGGQLTLNNGGFAGVLIKGSTTFETTNPTFLIKSLTTNLFRMGSSSGISGGSINDFEIRALNGGNILLTPNNVGINTSTPLSRLDVRGNLGSGGIFSRNSSNPLSHIGLLTTSSKSALLFSSPSATARVSYDGSDLNFFPIGGTDDNPDSWVFPRASWNTSTGVLRLPELNIDANGMSSSKLVDTTYNFFSTAGSTFNIHKRFGNHHVNNLTGLVAGFGSYFSAEGLVDRATGISTTFETFPSSTATYNNIYGIRPSFANSAGVSITNQYGIYISSDAVATNNYGIYSGLNTGWNLYVEGTAKNYLAGNLGIGTSSPTQKLDVNGNAIIRGASSTIGEALEIRNSSGQVIANFNNNVRGEVRIFPNLKIGNAVDPGKIIFMREGDGTVGASIDCANYEMAMIKSSGASTEIRLAGTGIQLSTQIDSAPFNMTTKLFVKNGTATRVGIGTTNPLAPLHVEGTIISTSDIEITDATKGVILKSSNGNRWRIIVDNTGALTTTAL